MWFTSCKRLLSLSVVVLLVICVLQIWVCCNSCQVGAIRIFPENAVPNVEFSHRIILDNKNKNKNKKEMEDPFNKYFSAGRTFGPNNRTQKGFDETKRRVPSCPDPLHN